MARILVLYQYFATRRGSWGTRFYEFGKRWVEQGHQVTIVTSVYDKSDLRSDRWVWSSNVEGIDVIAVNIGVSNKHGTVRRVLSFAAYSAISSFFAVTLPADVVVASSGPLTIGIPGLAARWLRRRPLIFEVRDLWPRGAIELGMLKNPIAIALSKLLERVCYASAHQVVALAPSMKDWIQRVVPGAPVVTITNAADLDLFDPARVASERIAAKTRGHLCLLYAGTLGKANFGPELLDIAAKLKSLEKIRLFIAGDGSEREELMQRAEQSGLDNVEFLGLLSKEEVAEWHAAVDIILIGLKPFPGLEDGSPNKLFDALAAGRPIVNNARGWVAQLLEDNDCGLNYRAGDIDTAVAHIRSLAAEPERRGQMGQNGRRLAEREFDRSELAARFARLFDEYEKCPRPSLGASDRLGRA